MRGKILFCLVALVLLVGTVSADTLISYATYNGGPVEFDPSGQTWSSIILGGGDGVNGISSFIQLSWTGAGSSKFDALYRVIIGYNTTIPLGSIITSAKVSVSSAGENHNNGGINPNYTIVDAYPGGTVIATADFSKTNKVRQASDVIYGSCGDTVWCNWTLTNLTYINKTGITAYMLMVSFDKDNVTPGSIAGQESGLWIRTIAYSGGTKKPFITITYTPADTTPPASITNLANVTNCSQINITFTKPADADYNGSMIWWNDAAQTNLTSTDTFKLFTGLIQNTAYTFASKTFDNATPANVNATFTNHTATTLTSVTASFTKNQTAGLQPLSVMFNDTSTGSSVNQWNWSFGDGTWQNGTTQNATKIYSSGGEYSIFLIGSNTCGSNTSASQTINVYNQTLSGFSANITEGLMPLSVMFSVTNSNDNASFWNWSFGDGTWQNGTSQNATYIYPTGGLYSVTEIAGNTWSSSTTTRTDYINVWNLTSISSFTANTTTGSAPLPVSFTDVSYNATNWYTEFGDGNTSVIKSPEFTYNIPGLYTVNHRAYSGYDSSWLNQTDYINVTVPVIAPVTGFSANATSGISSLAVGFTDSSTNTPTNWDWYFWPNETKSSDLQNPEQIFTIGLYDIRLYSSNSAGGDWENKTAYINVTAPPLAPPTAVFSGVPTSGNAPLLVTFTDASTNTPISWYWEFGEGNTSILQNPTNTYGSPGTYSVNLRATNADGFDWENKTNYITANISPTPTPTPTPIPVTPNVDRNKRIVDPITWVKNWFNDIRHVGE